MKKAKTITISDIENAFKHFRKPAKKIKENYYIFITDKQLKEVYGFTDEEIETLHKNSK